MSREMRIVIDDAIPYAEPAFGSFGQLLRVPGREIARSHVRDADALIVRTVTRVDADLLADSAVRFVGSCTIGTDHLATDWLTRQGIHWCHAPGCNANAVAEYVLAAAAALDGVLPSLLSGQSQLGLIGYGNVGRRVHARCAALGIECLAYDPLLPQGVCPCPANVDEVLACDVVSVHVPLTADGDYPTLGMLDSVVLQQLPQTAVLINSSRGEVVDNATIKQLHALRPDVRLVLDVWQGEPEPDIEAIDAAEISTSHIAGYSQEGKLAGTTAVMQQLAQFVAVPAPLLADIAPRGEPELVLSGPQSMEPPLFLQRLLRTLYDIRADHAALRQQSRSGMPGWFEQLRRDYRPRQEWAGVRVSADNAEVQQLLDRYWPAVIGAHVP